MILPPSFYQSEDVVGIARALIGKLVFTRIDNELTGGIIVETEAYKGPEDRGSHAHQMRRTARNESMYSEGGTAYVYICYGIHNMLNVVTNRAGIPHAVLIRAIEPLTGIRTMVERRGILHFTKRICAGPGSLAKALGISKAQDGISLLGKELWLEDQDMPLNEEEIIAAPRVGMNFDGPYKSIPWRFYLKGNKFVSKG